MPTPRTTNHFDKTHLICHVLQRAGVPMTRVDILRQVYAIDHMDHVPFQERSNHCYFSKYGHGNGGYISLVFRGYLTEGPKLGRTSTYILTRKGVQAAKECQAFLTANPGASL